MFEWRLRWPEASRGLKPTSTSDLNYEGRFLHIYWLCFSPPCVVKRQISSGVRVSVCVCVMRRLENCIKSPLFELTVTRLSLFWFCASPNWIYLAALYIECRSWTSSREGRCNYTIWRPKNDGMLFIRRVRSSDLSSRSCLICRRLNWRQRAPERSQRRDDDGWGMTGCLWV